VYYMSCVSQNDDMNEYFEEGVSKIDEVNNFVEVHNPSYSAEMKRRAILDILTN